MSNHPSFSHSAENPTTNRFDGRMCARLAWAALFLVLLLTAVIRIRILEIPLERDEGHYAYVGQLILDGVPPYRESYSYFLPGIYMAYAGILAVFDQTRAGIHLGLLIINAVSIVLVFMLSTKLFGSIAGTT